MNAAVKPIKEAVRLCGGCGNPLVRKLRSSGELERMNDFNKRKLCGHGCKSARMLKSLETKYCCNCNTKLVRKMRPCGRLETLQNFTERQSCGRECANAAMTPDTKLKRKYVKQGPVEPVRHFDVCKAPVATNIETLKPPREKIKKSRSGEFDPIDYTKKTEQGFFKETPRGIFRWNGWEWVRSTKDTKEEPKKIKKRSFASPETVRAVRADYDTKTMSASEIGRKYNICAASVTQIGKRKTYQDVI